MREKVREKVRVGVEGRESREAAAIKRVGIVLARSLGRSVARTLARSSAGTRLLALRHGHDAAQLAGREARQERAARVGLDGGERRALSIEAQREGLRREDARERREWGRKEGGTRGK